MHILFCNISNKNSKTCFLNKSMQKTSNQMLTMIKIKIVFKENKSRNWHGMQCFVFHVSSGGTYDVKIKVEHVIQKL